MLNPSPHQYPPSVFSLVQQQAARGWMLWITLAEDILTAAAAAITTAFAATAATQPTPAAPQAPLAPPALSVPEVLEQLLAAAAAAPAAAPLYRLYVRTVVAPAVKSGAGTGGRQGATAEDLAFLLEVRRGGWRCGRPRQPLVPSCGRGVSRGAVRAAVPQLQSRTRACNRRTPPIALWIEGPPSRPPLPLMCASPDTQVLGAAREPLYLSQLLDLRAEVGDRVGCGRGLIRTPGTVPDTRNRWDMRGGAWTRRGRPWCQTVRSGPAAGVRAGGTKGGTVHVLLQLPRACVRVRVHARTCKHVRLCAGACDQM